jgi:hypothetical protein
MKLEALTQEIVAEHHLAEQKAREAVRHAFNCGKLLAQAKKGIGHGNFLEWLKTTAIPERTARRYMEFAVMAAKNLDKLEQGKELVDLYREFGIVRAVKGGGYRSEVYQQRNQGKLLGLQTEFAFEECCEQLNAIVSDDAIEKLAESSLEKLESQLEESLNKVREVKAKRGALIV